MDLVHQARLQLPRWILQKTWDFQFYRSYDGWKFQLKNWNIRPNDSPIFRFVKEGRTDLILEAFDRNEASLYDVNEMDETLIEVFCPSSYIPQDSRILAINNQPSEPYHETFTRYGS